MAQFKQEVGKQTVQVLILVFKQNSRLRATVWDDNSFDRTFVTAGTVFGMLKKEEEDQV